MKRRFLIILFLFFGLCMSYAESSFSLLYSKWMIEDINHGRFDQAIKDKEFIEEWSLNSFPEIDLDMGISFADYAESIGESKTFVSVIRLLVISQCLKEAKRCDRYGYYILSIAYYELAAQLYEKISGKKGEYAHISIIIGGKYLLIGEDYYAEGVLLEAAEICRKNVDEDPIRYAEALYNLGKLYGTSKREEYDKAEHFLKEALHVYNSSKEKDPWLYTLILSECVKLYISKENYVLAEKYLSLVTKLHENELYSEDKAEQYRWAYVDVLYLGAVINEKGRHNYREAKSYYLKAIDFIEEIGESHSLLHALCFQNLGDMNMRLKNFRSAEQYYKRELEILGNGVGSDHPDYVKAKSALGNLYLETHHLGKAERLYRDCFASFKELFLTSMNHMSERQRKIYWKPMADLFERGCPVLSYRMSPKKPSVSAFAYDNELFKKGLLLASSNAIRQSVLESGDTTLTRRWEELTHKKQQIMALEEKGTMSDYLETVRREAEGLEKAIIGSSASYRENMRQWNITWDSVRAELKPNEVAIEFMAAPLNEDSTMYCALLLRDTCSYPILIPLFEKNEVAGLVDVSMPMSLGHVYAYTGYGKQLSQIIWSKITPYIHANEAVYFAPTGLLHQLAIENLPYDATHTMSDVYQMVRVSSTRELALHKAALPHQKASLYGGIFYEANASDLLAASMPYHRSVTAPITVDSLNRSQANYLPATKKEVEQIRQTLKTKNIDVHVYSTIDGNEESFKALSGTKQNVLHLATHGFFWQDATATIDPMERSGLLLAGANMALSGHPERIPEGVEDGILTAKEISVLDFRHADIVVLSACETAKGDVSGEGVFGLQRAFKMAGAQTILMSLWKVDDEATQILMTAFYRNYSKGLTKRQAFRKAQEEVRNHTKTTDTSTTKPYESPYFWAGFILLD